MPKHHRPFANLAAAVAIAALCLPSLPAQASPERPARALTHDIFSFLGFGQDQANNPTDPTAARERPIIEIAPSHASEVDARPPHLPVVAALTPSVETPLRRLFCVEYARMRSGLAVFGDAKHWWARAKNLYARLPHPVEEAVMVFSGSKRLKRGHVAVVTEIVSPRQIIVDQANWQNKGEIDHATPVLDVSAKNDWSKVRVWDIPSGTFGRRVYAISGFIAKEFKTASRY
ncbi:MAG: CHAP domain-containing protein [Rhizomicrobium sp.]